MSDGTMQTGDAASWPPDHGLAIHRGLFAAIFGAIVALLLFVSAANASMGVSDLIGGQGTTGGLFEEPRGVAINDTTGDIYIVDAANNRIQQLDSSGAFIRAWGWNVAGPGGGSDDTGSEFEICTQAVAGAANCKAGDAGAGFGQLKAPMAIAVDQTDGSVYVTDPENRRIQKFDASGHFLRMWGQDVLSPAGGTTAEICTAADAVAPGCKAGEPGSVGGALGGPRGIAVAPPGAPNAGNVLVADTNNRRIQEFTSAGTFVRAFGWDVAGPGAGSDDLGEAFEVCTASVAGAANCQAGGTGNQLGQFGAGGAAGSVAVDSTGAIYTVESGENYRVQKFVPSGGSLTPTLFGPLALLGSEGGDSPLVVAIDASDRVFVMKGYGEGAAPCYGGSESRILELDTDGNLQATHMVCAEVTEPFDVAVNPFSGHVYVSHPADKSIYVLDDVPAPLVSIESAAEVTAHTAVLKGAVDPAGRDAIYHFEYTDDNFATVETAPLPGISIGNGTGPVSVEEPIASLTPGATYKVRLVARRDFNASVATTAAVSFTTQPTGPEAETIGVSGPVQGSSARLSARINPEGASTRYRFEYGPDSSYGSLLPEGPAIEAGDGSTDLFIGRQLTGLEPNHTYHYRVIAENGFGQVLGSDQVFSTGEFCPNDSVRVQQAATHLPSCRAYELVSQADMNGNHVQNVSPLSTDGNRVLYSPLSGGMPGSSNGNPVLMATRTASGWQTTSVLPDRDQLVADNYSMRTPTAGMDSLVMSAIDGLGNSPSIAGIVRVDADGQQTVLHMFSRSFGSSAGPEVVASADLKHVFVNAPELIDPSHQAGTNNVYDIGSGVPELVSRMSGSGVAPTCGVEPGSWSFAPPLSMMTDNWVSTDGTRAFFMTRGDDPNCEAPLDLYRRDTSTNTTTLISGPPGIGDPNFGLEFGDNFLQAAADGSWVVYLTASSLDPSDDSDGNAEDRDVYRWVEGSGNNCMTCVVPTPQVGTVAVSESGSYVYFTSEQSLAGGATPGVGNLYALHAGQIRYIGPSDEVTATYTYNGQVTPDGNVLLFASNRPGLDPLSQSENGGFTQMYRYDYAEGSLTCLSCVPGGAATGEAVMQSAPIIGGAVLAHNRLVSDDGDTAIFRTPDALVPEDTNRELDVYQWHDGHVGLITDGLSRKAGEVNPVTLSADGRDLLFLAGARLTSDARKDGTKLYDARIGGGFDQGAGPPMPCEESSCRPGSTPPPGLLGGGSDTNSGSQQVRVKHRKKRRKHAHRKDRGAKHKSNGAKHGQRSGGRNG